MTKNELKEHVLQNIDGERAVRLLKSLIRIPSASGQPTLPQELVLQYFEQMGMQVDMFQGNDEEVKNLPDYCPLPPEENIDSGAFNLVGVKKGKSRTGKSLMLFSHIDTEAPEPDSGGDPLQAYIRDGKLYGLGAADAKSGIAIMLAAAQAVLKETELDGELILMSILGKKGGSAGTLSAVSRGYHADGGVYIHAAETGHGFQEIKCYSMGTIDFRVIVKGSGGAPNDELDDSEVNAVEKGALVIRALREWDSGRRSRLMFKQGTYEGSPNTKLHIGLAQGGTYVGKDPLSFEVQCRLYFGVGETIESVLADLNQYLTEALSGDPWLREHMPVIEKMYLRASPAETDTSEAIHTAAKDSIIGITGTNEIIYQYHGASDIRLPVLYGNTPTVGIGPKCGGLYGQETVDWVDLEDFLTGIKICAALIIDWCLED